MSSYKGHLFGGVLFFIPFVYVLGILFDYDELPTWQYVLQLVILFGITLLFALFPDVDIKSKGQKIFYWIFLILDLVLIVRGLWREAAFLGLFAMTPLISKHRGWTHSLWAAFLIPLPFIILPMWYANANWTTGLPYYLAAVTGNLSHRFMDGIFFGR
jgi:membrane-bound metal-dependent hydrolase YbcI (DUF457 family)